MWYLPNQDDYALMYFVVSSMPNENGDFVISGLLGDIGSANKSSFSSSAWLLENPVSPVAKALSEPIPASCLC